MINACLCRYHEIATKGDNRNQFELQLVENLYRLLKGLPIKVHRVRGRIWMEKNDGTEFSVADLAEVGARMEKAFGLSSWSPAVRLPAGDFQAVKDTVLALAPQVFARVTEPSGKENVPTFRIRARRSDKKFPMRSKEIEIALATALWQQLGGDSIKLDLENADVTIGVEIREEMAMVFLESFSGPGGLPVGANDRTLALLSGGIDSPVACWMIMKRGSQVEFVTFHSAPYTPPETVAKVEGIAALLNTFQRPARLAACNLAEMQKLIRDNCDPRLRTVLHRRMMVRIAAKVAERFKAGALVTGDALGQVASQTLCNMSVIDQASPMLILRPTVGMDKLETIHIAEKIGSFELSSVQVPDSCTVFAPSRPTTRADLEKVIREEARIPDWEKVVEEIAANAVITRPGE